jgi:hypothetical protein
MQTAAKERHQTPTEATKIPFSFTGTKLFQLQRFTVYYPSQNR